MSGQLFHALHLIFLLLLAGVTFAAFAAPQEENRKRILMLSGIFSLIVFVAGFGLLGIYKIGFPGWIIIKIICWFILSALAGLAFRLPSQIKLFSTMAIAVIVIAVLMVDFRPF